MTNTVLKTARQVGGSVVEGASMTFALAAAGVGGCMGFDVAPASWAPGWRAFAAGVVGVVFALGADELVDPLVRPLRRLTSDTASRPASYTGIGDTDDPDDAETALPDSPEDAIARVAEAACADAASHAAADSYRIDHGRVLLYKADRWQGFEDGTARFYLAPGAQLRYWRDTKDGGAYPRVEYTFVSSDADDPIEITSMRQLRELLEVHANPESADRDYWADDSDLQTA